MNCVKCRAELQDGALYCHKCGKKQTLEKKKALKRPNGSGTVYKLQGRRQRPWVAAKGKIIIGYYDTKTAALEALNRLAGQDITERYNMTFTDVYKAWKEEHYRDLTKAGQAQYDIAYKNVFCSLHDRKFRSLKTADFQAVIDQHMHKTHSTVSKYKQLITQMSKWALREEIITTNLAAFVKLPQDVKKEKQIFTDDEIKKIEGDGSETARIVCMLLATGMRIGELFNLKLADYHETYVVGGSKTDAGRNRIIPIRAEGRPHFAYFATQSEGKDKLLDGYVGNKDIHNFRVRDYDPLLKRLGIDTKKTPHTTRHTYSSRAVKEGLQPEILQKILGHADFSTTANIYTHLDADTLVHAVEALAVTNTLLTNQAQQKNEKS